MEYEDDVDSNGDPEEVEEDENLGISHVNSNEPEVEEPAEIVEEEIGVDSIKDDDQFETNTIASEGITQATQSVGTLDDATRISAFTSDVAETMNALRGACADPPDNKLAQLSLEAVKIMCKERFQAKHRLGSSGASEHLIFIFRRYRSDRDLAVLGCEAISEYMIGETENKIMMGAVGLVEEIVPTMELFPKDKKVLRLVIKLAIDCCHSKLSGLLQKYTKPKPGKPNKPPAPPGPYPDYYDIDNRARLGEVGFCQYITKILHSYAKAHHEFEDKENLLITICHAIAAIATNDKNSTILGQSGICKCLTTLLGNKKLTFELHTAMLWAIITLCTDPNNGNQHQFGEEGICKIIVDHLHEVQRTPTHFAKDPFFKKYMEYLAWCLMNLIRYCPENMKNIRNITYAQVVIDNILSIDVIPRSAKVKLNQVYIDTYEKLYLDTSTPFVTEETKESKEMKDS
jgi:hypothetical protein